MKRSYRGVLLLCSVLLFNIVFTQYTVHQFYYENYEATILFALLNIVLFLVAFFIYKKEKLVSEGAKNNEK